MAPSNEKTKRNLSASDLENEATHFLRFIVIEPLGDVCLAKFSLFWIENGYYYESYPQKT